MRHDCCLQYVSYTADINFFFFKPFNTHTRDHTPLNTMIQELCERMLLALALLFGKARTRASWRKRGKRKVLTVVRHQVSDLTYRYRHVHHSYIIHAGKKSRGGSCCRFMLFGLSTIVGLSAVAVYYLPSPIDPVPYVYVLCVLKSLPVRVLIAATGSDYLLFFFFFFFQYPCRTICDRDQGF